MIGETNMIYWLVGTGLFLSLFITFVIHVVYGIDDDDATDDGL